MIAWLEEAEKLKQTKIRDKNRSEAGGDTTHLSPHKNLNPHCIFPSPKHLGSKRMITQAPSRPKPLSFPGWSGRQPLASLLTVKEQSLTPLLHLFLPQKSPLLSVSCPQWTQPPPISTRSVLQNPLPSQQINLSNSIFGCQTGKSEDRKKQGKAKTKQLEIATTVVGADIGHGTVLKGKRAGGMMTTK